MSDYGDFCREQRQRQQRHRSEQAERSFSYVKEMAALGCTVHVLQNGHRFVLPNQQRIDFWPSTGKWTVVGSGNYSTSPKAMVAYAKGQRPAEPEGVTNPTLRKSTWTGAPTGKGNAPWKP